MPEVAGDPRSAFHLPPDVTYLNCAYMGPLPRSAVEAGWSALDRKARPWTIAADDFFVPAETYRSLVAELLGADADGVAVTPAVSYGLSTFAANLPLTAGQVVLVPADEFPSALLPWTEAAARAGAEVVRVPADGPDRCGPLLAEVERRGEQVALVSAPACHWTDGTPFDLVALRAATRAVGALLAVDVAQSLGVVPFDAAAVAPDVVAGATYKWLLGPYSLGFAWFAPAWREGRPLEHSWIGRAGAEDFAALTSPSDGYRPGARRYDMGEGSQHSLMGVALAGLQLVRDWGPAATAAHARPLIDRVAAGATELGLTAPPPEQRSPHLVGLSLAETGIDAAELASRLADDRVHVSVRGTSIRVSAHRFNTDEDVDRLLASLTRAVGRG
ncbi:aminotransferase class V-fold PLP-dependent enzyme [Iamia sp. SCSIO 61187]|uniref:aminotransferase class V-fold PLP-dependent enzyme n=1 Tax=Iamia sp. SCSIO 61187 TaxID=2722752 RepID=UPI001C6396EB|nr:aminotransferase class V-fold PLP-dependent enzyme [Iamia sp. SCSIO 61187]QYG94093.1 aminotransferase class V-fold PLP-dependent enzyme [Iamia sp. SCSIO 61187]